MEKIKVICIVVITIILVSTASIFVTEKYFEVVSVVNSNTTNLNSVVTFLNKVGAAPIPTVKK